MLLAVSLLTGLFVLAAVPASTPPMAPTFHYDIAAVVGTTQNLPAGGETISVLDLIQNIDAASSRDGNRGDQTGSASWTTVASTYLYDFVAVVGRAPTFPIVRSPTPTATPTPTPTPEPTPEPTPDPTPMPASYYKQQLLDLINQARSDAGLTLLTLADSPLPQMQAESALENCLFSNWGMDGLKPYMRFSLAGGYQANGEIVGASGLCSPSETPQWSDGDSVVLDLIAQWRTNRLDWTANVLNPWYSKVSIGLNWNDHFYAAHLVFERDFIEFTKLPSISADGTLSVRGSLKTGVSLPTNDSLLIDVYYDPPPQSLSPGQLAGTNCYVYGETGYLVAALRPPPPPDHNYPNDSLAIDYVLGCADPYDVQPDTPAPTEFMAKPSVSLSMDQGTADWVTARKWNVSDDSFSVTADLAPVIDEHGKGVYTILVWAVADNGEDVLVGTYSVFVGIPTPTLAETH